MTQKNTPGPKRLPLSETRMNHISNKEAFRRAVERECAAEKRANELADLNAELLEAVTIWMRFFDTMPKGQFGKISCDIGLMNNGFIKSRAVIQKATEVK